MIDVECPYCGSQVEINHDDGYGTEDGGDYEQQCWECDKVFAYTTSVILHHTVRKAPCLNGGDHEWYKVRFYPRDTYEYWDKCRNCGIERRK